MIGEDTYVRWSWLCEERKPSRKWYPWSFGDGSVHSGDKMLAQGEGEESGAAGSGLAEAGAIGAAAVARDDEGKVN